MRCAKKWPRRKIALLMLTPSLRLRFNAILGGEMRHLRQDTASRDVCRFHAQFNQLHNLNRLTCRHGFHRYRLTHRGWRHNMPDSYPATCRSLLCASLLNQVNTPSRMSYPQSSCGKRSPFLTVLPEDRGHIYIATARTMNDVSRGFRRGQHRTVQNHAALG